MVISNFKYFMTTFTFLAPNYGGYYLKRNVFLT